MTFLASIYMNTVALFNDSFEKCLHGRYSTFFERFYRNFEQRQPEVRRMFQGTDVQRRYDMFEESILILVDYSANGTASENLERLATLHTRKGATPEMFDEWMDALIQTLREVDPQFDDNAEFAWRDILSTGLEYLKNSARVAIQKRD